jgi:RimJ/RimL family protein N-acetyltransferase
MNDVPVLQGPRVTLRRPREDDAAARFKLGRNPEIAEMFGVSRHENKPLTREEATKWVQRLSKHPHAWAIEHGSFIGEIRLDNVDLRDHRASMAIGILDAELLGNALGTEAIMLVLGYAFRTLQLHRVGVRVLAYNKRAIRAYEKCGFVVEGRERETAFVNGTWHDDIMMGLLAHEFEARMRGSRPL